MERGDMKGEQSSARMARQYSLGPKCPNIVSEGKTTHLFQPGHRGSEGKLKQHSSEVVFRLLMLLS